MTLQELMADLRRRLDDEVEPTLWSDDALRGYLNDADRQSIIRQRLLLDVTSDACCKIALVPDQQIYPLNPTVLAVRSARVVGASCDPLQIRSAKHLWRRVGDWHGTTARGAPDVLVPDLQTGAIAVYPVPAVAGELRLAVWRTRFDAELMDTDQDEPQTPPHQRIDLLDWAEHRAYACKDAELYDERKSNDAEARFDAKFGRLPSAHEIRLWGISPLRGTTAEFL